METGFTNSAAHLLFIKSLGSYPVEMVTLINHENGTIDSRSLLAPEEMPEGPRQFLSILKWVQATSVRGQATDRAWLSERISKIAELSGCDQVAVEPSPFPEFPSVEDADAWAHLYELVDLVPAMNPSNEFKNWELE